MPSRLQAQGSYPTVHVRDFGARGDGATNDTDALFAASGYIGSRGGGTIVFDRATYLIGKQRRGPGPLGWAFEPQPVIDIRGCRGKVNVVGNGARLVCAPGLRYGTFDARTGGPTRRTMPFYDAAEIATPYRAAVWLQDNHGGLEISGFEIDGRIGVAAIGGPWGDTGWQINHCGIWLYNNRGEQIVRDVYAHHHGQDGMQMFTEVRTEADNPGPMRVTNFRGEYNGRQGISLTGGRDVSLVRCQLNHTGKNGVITSNPGAGLDIEAELSLIRDVTISECEFIGNYGQGLTADTGDSEGVSVSDSRFVGSTNYAVWPNKPRIRFDRCEFVGGVVRCFEDPSGTARATQFHDCLFLDDPARTPTGEVYGSRIDLGGSGGGTLFNRCTFRYTHAMQLPYSPETVRYQDCTMSQRSPERAYPAGIYSGTNRINGNVSLGSSIIRGIVLLNGLRVG